MEPSFMIMRHRVKESLWGRDDGWTEPVVTADTEKKGQGDTRKHDSLTPPLRICPREHRVSSDHVGDTKRSCWARSPLYSQLYRLKLSHHSSSVTSRVIEGWPLTGKPESPHCYNYRHPWPNLGTTQCVDEITSKLSMKISKLAHSYPTSGQEIFITELDEGT